MHRAIMREESRQRLTDAGARQLCRSSGKHGLADRRTAETGERTEQRASSMAARLAGAGPGSRDIINSLPGTARTTTLSCVCVHRFDDGSMVMYHHLPLETNIKR
jgi:hypothetical protein